ncbi:MAG: 2-phospho-L-lactate guanylyltransferase [Candidatus Binatia bacterium]
MKPRPTTAALVPVRALNDAKRRLSSELGAPEREELTLEMLRDMLGALAAAPSLGRIVVVSTDPTILAEAQQLGAETLQELEPKGLNGAVAWAAHELERSGVRTLLTIPGDVPLIAPAEVERLLAIDSHRYPVVLVPSASGTGTNALLTSPPTIIDPAFEGLSLAAHGEACRRSGLAFRTLPLGGFALDVDTPDDFMELARRGGGCFSGRFATRALQRRTPPAQASG